VRPAPETTATARPDARTAPPATSPATPSVAAASADRTDNGAALPVVTRLATTAPRSGESTSFTWAAGDDDGFLQGYDVDFGDGSSTTVALDRRCQTNPADPVADRPSFGHTYSSPGHYRVILRVTSAGSCGTGTRQTAERVIEIDVALLPPVGVQTLQVAAVGA
jgi:hypothetical protein